MAGEQTDFPQVPDLTAAERRLLPLLSTSLSLSDTAQALAMSPDEVVALSRSIYAKLGLGGEGRPTDAT